MIGRNAAIPPPVVVVASCANKNSKKYSLFSLKFKAVVLYM